MAALRIKHVDMANPKYITTPPPGVIERTKANVILDYAHLTTLNTAFCNILASDIAEITFAQILDGLPLKDVAFVFGNRGNLNTIYDPVFKHL